jgi:hypothetical protein
MYSNKLIDCQVLKMRWEDYDVGGKFYGLGGSDFTEIVNRWKKEYADKGCGADPLLEKCSERELYIQNLQNKITEKNQQNDIGQASRWTEVLNQETKKFSDLGCNAKIQESRNIVLGEKINKYTTLDKQRIEAESKYQANKKIFIGGSFILVAVALIVILKK